MSLRLGDTAPDFTAESTEGAVRFHDWIGDSWAVLFSHPKDFTPVCTTELGYVARLKPEFDKRHVKAIGLSVDPVTSHKGWAADIKETQGHAVNFPIIADPEKKVADLYGMMHPAHDEVFTVRTVFVIDPKKKIRLMITYPQTTGRNFDEILRVIDSLQLTDAHRVATPVNWKQGEDVIIVPAVTDEEAKAKFPKGWKALKTYVRLTTQPTYGADHERCQEPLPPASRGRRPGEAQPDESLHGEVGEGGAQSRAAGRLGLPALPVRVPVRAMVCGRVRRVSGRGRPRFPPREHHRGGIGRQARRSPDPLRGSRRGESQGSGNQAAAPHNPWAHRLVLRDFAAAVPRRGRRPPGGPRVPGAGHLPAQPPTPQVALRIQRSRGGVLRHPHRGGRGPRGARIPDRGAAQHYRREAGRGGRPGPPGHRDALAVHDRSLPRVRPQGRDVTKGGTPPPARI